MKKFDYWLQKQRNKQAQKNIVGNTILDIGCHQGELFDFLLKKNEVFGDGIDTVLTQKIETKNYTLFSGQFPEDFSPQKKYENITLLAVMEHIPISILERYPMILSKYLTSKGRVIITIPTKKVDYILEILLFFKLIDGMDIEHHQDFDRLLLKKLFVKNGYRLVREYSFELGLNLVFVFEKVE